jgi:hypothetical protein
MDIDGAAKRAKDQSEHNNWPLEADDLVWPFFVRDYI